ncbi:MAG: FkbM family methyltransferase, partial [Chitinophagales bacterium]|nr:FkbM family methyltransferase [Chitinophagales bacterium]
VYYLGFYERGTLEVMSACLRPGDTFVDVGAHVGLMSLFAARCVGNSGRVLAVEPVSELHGLLQQSVQMNGFTQVRTLHCALGASHARLPISLAGSCPSLVTSAAGGETETVEVLPLDELLTEKDWPVRMVKIDVEGYELEVITGAQKLLQRHDAPLLCLEYNESMRGRASDPLAVFRLIESLNAYRFFQLEKTKATPSRLKACRPESFRKEDNVFACTEAMQHQLPQALFA